MSAEQKAQQAQDKAAEAGDKASDAQDKAEDKAEDAGRTVQQNRGYRILVRVGLVAYGVVHLLLASLAVQLALGGSGEEASSSGALQQLAEQPFGGVLLAVVAGGLLTLTLWQLIEAAIGHGSFQGRKRVRKRLSSLGKAVVYTSLGVSAIRTATGSGSSGGGEEQQQGIVGQLIAHPAGVVLVLLVAAAVVALGMVLIVKGVRRKFTEDMAGQPGSVGLALGLVGHVAKGLVFLVVAGLLVTAVITRDPEKAGGMDAALRTVLEQPYGVVLLMVMAAGLACYGLYCFVWARRPEHG